MRQPRGNSGQKHRILGLGLEIWIVVFGVIASIPLLNMFALPVIIIAFSVGVAVYLLWRERDFKKRF